MEAIPGKVRKKADADGVLNIQVLTESSGDMDGIQLVKGQADIF